MYRLTLVKGWNMAEVQQYADLVRAAAVLRTKLSAQPTGSHVPAARALQRSSQTLVLPFSAR